MDEVLVNITEVVEEVSVVIIESQPIIEDVSVTISEALQGDPGISAYLVAVSEGYPSTVSQWLASLHGVDATQVELQNNGTQIQWRLIGGSWSNLIALSAISGTDGKEIELQTNSTHIQWRYVGDTNWINLKLLSEISGTDGKQLEIRVDSGFIQTRLEGSAWSNLITVSSLIGASGRGISSIVRTSGTGAPGTTDIYTITYSDSTTSTFSVYNGANGITQDISGKVDKVTGKGLSTNDLTDTLKTAYDGAVSNSHAPGSDDQVIPDQLSDLSDDATHRLVTDTEKTTWNGKQPAGSYLVAADITGKVDKVTGKDLSANDLTDTLKSNYDTAYSHSQSAHAPSNAQKNSDIIKAEIEAVLTGVITTHSHIPQVANAPDSDLTISAGFSSYIPDYFEIMNTRTLELSLLSTLELG